MIATTVDEQGIRRAVTKLVESERLVSCTCCTTAECCMYPADQLGVGYTEDDLPDTIDFRSIWSDQIGRTLLSRNGQEYGPTTETVIVLGNTFTINIYVIIDLDFTTNQPIWFEYITGAGGHFEGITRCLLYPDTVGGGNPVEDTFEDTYEVTGPVNGTVTRQSRCVWTGTGLTLSNYGYQWTVNGRAKSGNQNTPVGSYADGYSVAL